MFGGSLSEAYARQDLQDHGSGHEGRARRSSASTTRAARASRKGVASLAGYADIFLRNTLASGVVPQLSAVLGPCAGGAVYSPAITDFIFMVESTSYMFITGPDVIRAVTHEEVTQGRARRRAHPRRPLGRRAPRLRRRAGLPGRPARAADLPAAEQPRGSAAPAARATSPTRAGPRARRPDPGRAVQALRHEGACWRGWSTTGTSSRSSPSTRPTSWSASRASTAGRWASWPTSRLHLAGCLDIAASLKAARFVRFCDCFNIPLVTFVDVPGLPARHRAGVRRHHQARREAAVRVRRGHGAQADGHHPQGLRRRLRRHVVQAHPRRPQLRLPDRRDRGHGPRGGGQHRLPRRAGPGRRSGRGARAVPGGVPREVRQPLRRPPSSATSTR